MSRRNAWWQKDGVLLLQQNRFVIICFDISNPHPPFLDLENISWSLLDKAWSSLLIWNSEVRTMSHYWEISLCADPGCDASGYTWVQFSSWGYFSSPAHTWDASNLFPNKQIHYSFPGDSWCLWVSFQYICCIGIGGLILKIKWSLQIIFSS